MNLKKYKWLYLWIAAAGLIVFGALMILIPKFGDKVVLYVSAALLIAFVIIRFVPLIKTTKNRWAICANSIEMFIDLAIGVIILVETIKYQDTEEFEKLKTMYAFMLGGVLYLRGLEYLVETTFLGTKPEVLKFLVHVLILSVGTVIFARFESFSVTSFRWLIAVAFCICGMIAVVDGGSNYNQYRKTYEKKKTTMKVKESNTIVDDKKIEVPLTDNTQDQPTIVA